MLDIQGYTTAKGEPLPNDDLDLQLVWLRAMEEVGPRGLDDNVLGWFQAPANIGYVVIGLMYGEGDFKKSLIYAINCGDDTDCTAATVGAVLGIMGGSKAIPAELSQYIGDRIATVALDTAITYHRFPQSCTELTDRIMRLLPSPLFAHGVYAEYTDGPTEIDLEEALATPRANRQPHLPVLGARFLERKPYSFDVNTHFMRATVSYETAPVLAPMGTLKAAVHFRNMIHDSRWEEISVCLPEGWSAEYRRSAYAPHWSTRTKPMFDWEITITAGERVEPINRVMVVLSSPSHPLPVVIPMTILG